IYQMFKSTIVFLLVAITINAVLSASSNPNIIVNPSTKKFLDPDGREMYFHGVNVMKKQFPWYPPQEFDIYESFGPQDMAYLQEWGLNVVRLGMMWAGAEPTQGNYNETYFDIMGDLVNQMNQYGIYALIDVHQDVWSYYYCGEGFPSWTCNYDLDFPAPLQVIPFHRPDGGDPSAKDCAKHPWASYYGTAAVSYTFQALYENYFGTQDAFISYWQKIAALYKGATNVLGYELINEPWAGDVYMNPELLVPGVADKLNLAPMYDNLNAAIRKNDSQHIIFFEPVTWDDAGVGFERVPGGDDFRNLSALSYHFYIPPDVSIDEAMVIRMNDLNKLECAGLLTEFGADGGDAPNVLDSMIHTMDKVEEHLQGWIFWEYKCFAPDSYCNFFFNSNGTVNTERVYHYSRSYAMAVAGTTKQSIFEDATSVYTITYVINGDCTLPTEIYINEAMRYPNGYTVQFIPELIATYTTAHNRIFVNHNIQTATELTIKITP
ncbi:hypothetical protein SAMD00019534_019540, partial [Acytostelium subglobosum LB1]|uniref:hypothetical protein n=1 Tax=Acytostelium subglobosum LB1 TaxID=1410327 RepID=UPI00064488BD